MSGETVVMRGVTAAYGRQIALSGFDLTLRPGECLGLVGHNGAGKSTAIKLMLGLLRPRAGEIAALGETPTAGAAAGARRRIGYLPEAVALYPSLTGAETLAFYARLKGRPVAANPALLERVGLADAARRRVGGYSKGMRQRLGLAQALLGEPRLLLLDEPTSGLDPAARQSFYAILRALRREGATILLSSHALAELEGQVDRVVVMSRGRKVVDGSIGELRALAAIRPRIRARLGRPALAVVNGPDAWAGWTPLGDGRVELACDEHDVAAALGGLPASACEVEVVRPSLDELYAAFQSEAP